jgi:SAM-dependent methyltransferase
MSATEEQVAFWNGPGGQRWVTEQRDRDAMLESYGNAALAAARVAHGEVVLDVGCGCGTTTFELGARVGRGGRVLGIDLSLPMIERARAMALPPHHAHVAFQAGDAGAMELPAGAFDVLYSRFGVMFFADPVTTFAHLRGALKRGARVAFVCWRAIAENPWATVPLDAAVRELGSKPEPTDASAPGPFAFADRGRVCGMLEQAGFRDAEAAAFDARVVYGRTPVEAAKRVAAMGPAARLLVDPDPATVARIVARTAEAIAQFEGPEGVAVPGAAWIVTARRA